MIKKFFNRPLIVISFICYIVLTVLIFALSLTDGEESTMQSAFVWNIISSILGVEGNYEHLIRKILGHFLLFSALAVFASIVYYRLACLIFTKRVNVYAIILTLLVGLITATISEILQLEYFTLYRNASLFDLLINFLGYIFGYLFYIIIKSYIDKNKKKLPVV